MNKKPTSKKIKTAILAFIAILGFTLSAYAQIQLGLDIDGEAASDESGYSVSMPDANTVAIGAPSNGGTGYLAGNVRVYFWDGSDWRQKGDDINGEAADDASGVSVSMPDANTVAIGAYRNNGASISAGHVRVFTWNDSTWIQKGFDIDGEAAYDNSGGSVSMPDANTVAIGATDNNGNGPLAGHVRVYTWNGTAWEKKGLDLDGEAAGDQSGWSVCMPDTNTVAIGSKYNDGKSPSAGHVRVYSWDGNSWNQKGPDIDGEAAGDYSGESVSMPDANTVAIGAASNMGNSLSTGHVRIYSWNGSIWKKKGLDLDGEDDGDYSGWTVSMPDANTVAIGSPFNNGNGIWVGHVRVFKWNANTWNQLGQDIDGEASWDNSGWSVSMPDENTVAIGAPGSEGLGTGAGQVRVYSLVTVGIIENSFTDKFTIYPNPTNGPLTIHFDTIQDELNVSLYTLDGKLLDNTMTKNTSDFTYVIKAPAGVYILKISNNKQEATVRVVKE
jgi:hypothetical protein